VETEPAAGGPHVAAVVSRCPDVGPACAEELIRPRTPGEAPADVVVLIGVGEAPDGVEAHLLDEGAGADAVAAALAAVAAAHGPITTLVTVPGHGFARSVARQGDDTSFDDHLAAELSTVHRAVRTVVPGMRSRKGGRIVVVSATTSLFGASWETAHGAAMAGLVGLVRSAARELAASQITVNAVLAGAIETEHLAEVRDRDQRGADAIAAAVAATPVRRLGEPGDIAAAVGFFASSEASYVTGVVLPVDGGLAMGIG
jgi:3-oxoacyl-[acyl-carrier protein] reductase